MYINDIASVLDHCKVSLYADDSVIYTDHNDVSEAVELVQKDLNNLSEWCVRNKLCWHSCLGHAWSLLPPSGCSPT